MGTYQNMYRSWEKGNSFSAGGGGGGALENIFRGALEQAKPFGG